VAEAGIVVAEMSDMKIQTSSRARFNSVEVPVLRWVMNRFGRVVTCELDATPDGQYEVCVVPHWDVQASVVQRFPNVMAALERHAEIARELRDAGWTVLAHLHPRPVPALA